MDPLSENTFPEAIDPTPAIEPIPAEPSAPPPSFFHRVFFGRFGFRAGWGISIFLIICVLLTVISGIAAVTATGHIKQIIAARMDAKAHPSAPKPHINIPFGPKLVTVNDSINFFGMLFVCWFFSKAERRHLGYYGIGSKRLRDFLPGAFWGLASLSVLVFTLHALHLLYFDSRLLFGPTIFLYGLKWLIAFLFVGFSEEYQLRGYLQYTLTRGVFGLGEKLSPERARLVSFWIAAVIMSLLFGTLHLGNAGENALGILQVVLVGLVFSYALWRTGSLWWSIGWHMAWDWAQSFLYGVADSGNISVGRLFQTHVAGKPLLSGGVDGPEGSILCVPILLLTFLVIRYTTNPGTQPPLEPLPAPGTVPPEAQPVIA
jgi:membrane protease YdiL (CAAX protease family)